MEWEKLLSREGPTGPRGDGEETCPSDYDTIICSTLFRRLQDKAQVFPLEEDDYVRTRLTHSLEVSAMGKKLGEAVFRRLKGEKKDPWFESHWEKEFSDVLLCAGLVHDIGNPPFGHFGEYAMREWFQANLNSLTLGEKRVTELLSWGQIQDLYHFEGNAQSLRLLSKTPHLGRMEGFNLSCSVLASIMKYPISSEDLSDNNPRHYKKMGYNQAERQLFSRINEITGLEGRRHPLSYLLEAADDMAYRTSDLEDAMVKKILSLQRILEGLREYEAEMKDESEAGANAEAGRNVGTGETRVGRESRLWGMKERVSGCIGKLEELYREEVEKRGRKPELTAVQRWNRHMQKVMAQDAADRFVDNYDRIMDGGFDEDLFDGTVSGHIIAAIARLSEERIYTSSVKIKTELLGRRVIESLLGQFMPAAVKYDTEEPQTFIERRTMDIISGFYKSMYHAEAEGKSSRERLYLRILMVTDYISGMTDSYARRLYKELFG